MKTRIVTIIVCVFSLTFALSAMVMQNHSKGKEGIRTESGIFNEDYLFTGQELRFSGEAEDLYFGGKRLSFDGKTKLGVFAFGEELVYTGMVGNGIISGGKEITVDGLISGSNFIGCKSFRLTEKGGISGDLFAGCAKLYIDGAFNGNLYAGAGEIIINSEINGNVTAYTGRITFGEKGKIKGNLVYSTKEKLTTHDSVKISGTITRDDRFTNNKSWVDRKAGIRTLGYIIGLGLFFSFVIVGCVLLFLPVFGKLDGPQPEKSFWTSSLWGLIPVLMYPAVILLCFGLVVTIPFAFVLMLGFVPLFYGAHIIGLTLFGKYLVGKFRWNVKKRHYQFLLGAAAVAIVSIIPIVNFLAMVFVSAVGWSVYISFLFDKKLTAAA